MGQMSSDFCRDCGANIPPKLGEGTCLKCDPVVCPHCQNDNMSLLEKVRSDGYWRCEVCSKIFRMLHG